MKQSVLTLLSFLLPLAIFAQSPFRDISFNEALVQSAETGKLIFLQYESEACLRCNEVANKAFEDKELSSELEKSFICIRISVTHPDRELTGRLYNTASGFGSFIIDRNKTLILSYRRSSTRASDYKEQIETALNRSGEEIRVNELEKAYRNGDKSIGLLELLLAKKKNLNLETDSLLNDYVSILSPDSLRSKRTLVFIANMAPLIGSAADKELRKDDMLFNQAWYMLPLKERIKINNRIIQRSLWQAVKDKDPVYANRIAAFARSTYAGNPMAGEKAYENNMLNYYKGVNDSSNYLLSAIPFYDKYYMQVSVDSIKRNDSLNLRKVFENGNVSTNTTSNPGIVKQTVQYATIAQFYTRELNEAARNFYGMTSNPVYISKALEWSKRANEFFEVAEAMDTYARLLYKTGNKSEAIVWEEKAIALQQKRGFPTKNLEATLEAIKQNSLIGN